MGSKRGHSYCDRDGAGTDAQLLFECRSGTMSASWYCPMTLILGLT